MNLHTSTKKPRSKQWSVRLDLFEEGDLTKFTPSSTPATPLFGVTPPPSATLATHPFPRSATSTPSAGP